MAAQQQRITEVLKAEEERFFETLANGMQILDAALAGGVAQLPGEVAFKLHDTFGFPLDLSADVCRERGLTVDEAGIFWSANAYMVLYSYAVDGRQRSSLWCWKGADVTPLNFLTWRFQLSQLLQSMPENPVPRTITQGEEPERFLAVMEGTIILSGSHPLTRPRPLAPEPSPATVAIVDAMQTSLSAGGAASGSGAAVAAAGEAEAPPPLAPVPIPVESLPSLKGVVLLQVKRYASTALGVCARQVRDAH
jgi:hypothetical protein